MELNELVIDRNQEPQWRETARWIKFEEEVEKETEQWGRPQVASLSFRSLLELRKAMSQGKGGRLHVTVEGSTLPCHSGGAVD